MSSYLHYLPEELLEFIVPLDHDAGNLFNLLEAFLDLDDKIINSFLFIYPTIYKTINKVSEYTKLPINAVFKILFKYIVTDWDTSDDYDFIEKYNTIIWQRGVILNYHDNEVLMRVGRKYSLLYEILLYLYFINDFPSIVQYYIDNIQHFEESSIHDLYKLYISVVKSDIPVELDNLVHKDSYDENVLIDILKLWMIDAPDLSVKDMIMRKKNYEMLKASGKYDKLIKFLLENDIDII